MADASPQFGRWATLAADPQEEEVLVGEPHSPPTVLIASALDGLRAAARVLTQSAGDLAVKPSSASNARWFMRAFVLRQRSTAVVAADTFWSNLEFARASCAASAASLTLLFDEHAHDPLVQRLHTDLAEVGYSSIVPALHTEAMPGREAETSALLAPAVARMKVCEARLLGAMQALARRSQHGDVAPS